MSNVVQLNKAPTEVNNDMSLAQFMKDVVLPYDEFMEALREGGFFRKDNLPNARSLNEGLFRLSEDRSTDPKDITITSDGVWRVAHAIPYIFD